MSKKIGLGLILLAGLMARVDPATAQSPPNCQPPEVGEYVLLVVSPTPETQEQVRRALLPNTTTTICKYLNDTVTRIGGFTQIEDANTQARYFNDVVGLSAFVAQAQTNTSPGSLGYSPQPLGAGYAVLVDYFNNPEVAIQVRDLLGYNPGFVSYGQRPYLLTVFTSKQSYANSILQKLSARGFFALLVDSRQVMLLKKTVSI